MKRRAVLKATAAAVAATGLPGHAAVSYAAPGDLARILDNVVTTFAGTAADQSTAQVRAKVTSIGTTAANRLRLMADPTTLPTTATALFTGVALGTSESALSTTFQYLADIALATVTPSTPQYQDTALRRRVVAGIDWVHRAWYGNQQNGYYGNWFHWEIGQPTALCKALVFVRDQLDAFDPTLLSRLVATMDAYLRAGKNGDVDLASRFHTGANLADITGNRIIQGALLGDEARVRKAVADQLTVFATIDPKHLVNGVTDGYYADGSFIQHSSVAYTGAYGKILLGRMVQSAKILDGTSYTSAQLVPSIRGWIRDGFAPVITEGYMMEIVKGRGVSRPTTGYTDVIGVIEAAVDVSRWLSGAEATEMKAYAKHLATVARVSVNSTSFVSPATIVAYEALKADATVTPADLLPQTAHVTFNAMERDVHRRPGFTFAVARSSSRISRYEYMSGENLKPWFQGSQAYYLYLAGQDQSAAYGCDFFATVPPAQLPGVTAPVETRLSVPEAYGGKLFYDNPTHPLGFTSSSVSQNTYVYFPTGTNDHSGGVRLGTHGAASYVISDDVAWRDKQKGILPADFVAYPDARGSVSVFMLDDQLVVLGAGISDPAGRAVTTTLDSRTCAVTDTVTVAGEGVFGLLPAVEGRRPWVRWENQTTGAAVGYVVLAGPAPVVTDERHTVPQSTSVRTASTGTADRRVVTVRFEHGAAAQATYAYVLRPGASTSTLQAEASTPPVQVVANTTTVQAVRHEALGITAATFFGAGSAENLVAEAPVNVMVQTLPRGRLQVAFSDPVRTQQTLKVGLRGKATVVGGDAGVTGSFSQGTTTLSIAANDGIGRTYTVELARG